MGYQYVTIDDGRLNVTYDGVLREYTLARDDDGAPAEATLRYHGDAWVEGPYIAWSVGSAVAAYRVGAETPESHEYYAGALAARRQRRQRAPVGHTTRYYYGWLDEWRRRAEALRAERRAMRRPRPAR